MREHLWSYLKSNYYQVYFHTLNRIVKINRNPVLILGNQKSGTTAVAALLAKCAGVSVTLDISAVREPVISRLLRGQTPLRLVIHRNRLDFSRCIIKEPFLTFSFDQVLECFQPKSNVFVMWDPRDNVRSVLIGLQLPGDLEDLSPDQISMLPPTWAGIVAGTTIDTKGQT